MPSASAMAIWHLAAHREGLAADDPASGDDGLLLGDRKVTDMLRLAAARGSRWSASAR